MRFRQTLVGVLLLGHLGCSDSNFFKDDLSISTLNGTWKVISFEDMTSGNIELKTQENSWGKDIIVTFDDTKNPHELSGTNITNSILGDFEYLGPRQFKMITFFSTEIAQPAWADKFIEAISDNEVTFEINSERFRIYYANKTKRMTLAK